MSKNILKNVGIGLLVLIFLVLVFGKQIKSLYSEFTEQSKLIETTTFTVPNILEIHVEVKGEVKKAGVYKVREGSRISDVLSLAILTTEADTSSINFAKQVKDEECILIPKAVIIIPSSTIQGSETSSIKSSSKNEIIPELLNLNLATYDELVSLSGIADAKAKKALAYLETGEKFRTYEEFVKIIGGLKNEYLAELKAKTILE